MLSCYQLWTPKDIVKIRKEKFKNCHTYDQKCNEYATLIFYQVTDLIMHHYMYQLSKIELHICKCKSEFTVHVRTSTLTHIP